MITILVNNRGITKKEFVRLQHHLFNNGFKWISKQVHTYYLCMPDSYIALDIGSKKIHMTGIVNERKIISKEEFFKLDLTKFLSNSE